jgi:magnesium transporter
MRRRVIKRFHPPGTTPGTLTTPVEGAAGPARLSLITYGPERLTERQVSALSEVPSVNPAGEQAWLRIVGHETSVLGELVSRFGVHPLVVEDVANVGQRPKVEQFDRYLFVVVDILRFGANGTLAEQQVSLLIFENLLVTIEEQESDQFKLVVERLRQGKMRQLPSTSGLRGGRRRGPLLPTLGESVTRSSRWRTSCSRSPIASFEELHRIGATSSGYAKQPGHCGDG